MTDMRGTLSLWRSTRTRCDSDCHWPHHGDSVVSTRCTRTFEAETVHPPDPSCHTGSPGGCWCMMQGTTGDCTSPQ